MHAPQLQVLLALIGFIVTAMALSEVSRAVSLMRHGRASEVLPPDVVDDAATEAVVLWALRSAIVSLQYQAGMHECSHSAIQLHSRWLRCRCPAC